MELEERRRREFKDQLDSRRQVMFIPHDEDFVPSATLPRMQTGASTGDVRSELCSRGSRHAFTAPSRRSASATQLSRASASGRQVTGSVGQASRSSFKSHRSAEISLHELQKQAADQEILNVRSALQEFRDLKDRRRTQSPGHLLHLSTLNMGCPQNLVTQQQRALTLPINMAVQPKWSTELKRMNDKIGERLRWERKISAAQPGSLCPERWFMPKQTYKSNPPTPAVRPDKTPK
jgi:hypothetical protein